MIRARVFMATAVSAALMCSPAGIAAAAGAPGNIVIAQQGGEGPKAGPARGSGGGKPAVGGAVRSGGGPDVRAPRMREGGGERTRPVIREGRRDRSPDRVIVDRRTDGVRNRSDRRVIRDRDGDRRPWRSGRRYAWGPGIYFYFYDGYYFGDCSWLRAKARATGSSYWWHRYRRCRADY